MTKTNKKRRPVTRSFWKFLRYMPTPLRARFLRAQFEVEYDLPEELVIKQAETESEIKQALTLVHDAYVDLGYMNENKLRLRFTKFLALPTTVILIAKWKEEVVGTISIVSDSAFGLPSDPVWGEHKLRAQGELLAEISTLCIKKDFAFRRGKLLMGLCKIMYLYCTQILKVDTIVASTTTEVEPFYTDILLFESLKAEKGNPHHMVNGNPSFFGYLPLSKGLQNKYKEIYNDKKKTKNLYHYFVEAHSSWIHLPKMKTSLQSYLSNKNKAVNEIILKNETLVKDFTETDLNVIQNLDASANLPALGKVRKLRRPRPRFEIRTPAVAFVNGSTTPEPCKIINVSESGLQIKLDQTHCQELLGKPILVVFEHEKEWITCQASIKWLESQKRLGCMVSDKSHSWNKFVHLVWSDVNPGSYKETG
jgi:hypothetical protein